MVSSKLSAFQREALAAIFARSGDTLFLTGGAALAGYHLGHRPTDDLDLFTVDAEAFQRTRFVIDAAAEALHATVEVRQDGPGFRRYAFVRGDDALVIDTVLERGRQLHVVKSRVGDILVDPPDEILANKLTAIVGRMEERDLVDVLCLERAGLRVEDALPAALAKDGGATPATLAWLLSEVRIPDTASLPAGVTPAELRAFIDELVIRLRRAAHPSGSR
ncbi:MAG: nucleotidyl transferase AbiEii/AbiGii toxin family protein [Myxococcales bacterium]|nr:nucleotidyl transferase AbiEii/AbiGii toxin family protein [Myxococcales bacterium]